MNKHDLLLRFMKSNHQIRVEGFMELAGQEVPERPRVPNIDTRRLRAALILEEALETIHALGFEVEMGQNGPQISLDYEPPDILGVIDGCCDLNVVSTGTLSAFGIPDKPMQETVDLANLRKFGTGSYRREDGKWMKPQDWEPPEPEMQKWLDLLVQ